jgi:hypothetical protein
MPSTETMLPSIDAQTMRLRSKACKARGASRLWQAALILSIRWSDRTSILPLSNHGKEAVIARFEHVSVASIRSRGRHVGCDL